MGNGAGGGCLSVALPHLIRKAVMLWREKRGLTIKEEF